ncbi:Protein of unknown function [Micromonospora pattaloongensis]|uniref:DUF742 domain-containing protein n=1 Tax=Micromonospora pattaloongensis TaxID=405436 RepID=A0A1H3SPV9_9ACTN|nr:DUF742 domain-containing protein [Micromonospora pattaloongensis]SDZ39964.1 Protein of unknown function [Micromonospora pattaloongensis]
MAKRHWKVRPYVLTGGRTRTRQQLLVHTLVSVPYYDSVFAAGLLPEQRTLYEHARETRSLAELSAFSGISLGVTRVVVDDLASTDRLLVHAETYESPFDRRLLERLLDGLRKLA